MICKSLQDKILSSVALVQLITREQYISGILTLVALSAAYGNDVPSVVHFQQSVNDYPFRNTSLPWKQRVDDLVSRLTLDEITQQVILEK